MRVVQEMWSIYWVVCGEYERDQWVLADEVGRIVGTGEWPEEYGRVCKEVKVALLLGKGVEGVSDTVMEEVGECIMYWIGKWWQRRKYLLYGELIDSFWFPLPSMNSWTQNMYYYCHIFLTYLFVN